MPTFGPENSLRDTFIQSGNPTFNWGARNLLQLDWFNPGEQRAMLCWDVNTIPTGVTVSSATLDMVVQNNTLALEVDCGAYPMLVLPSGDHFVEGTGLGSATGDGATWSTYDGSTSWTTAGGDYDAGFKSSFSIAPSETTKSIDVTTAVQKALTSYRGSGGTIAILLRRDTYSGSLTNYRLWSEQAATSANRPVLTINYTLPGGSRLPLLGVGR